MDYFFNCCYVPGGEQKLNTTETKYCKNSGYFPPLFVYFVFTYLGYVLYASCTKVLPYTYYSGRLLKVQASFPCFVLVVQVVATAKIFGVGSSVGQAHLPCSPPFLPTYLVAHLPCSPLTLLPTCLVAHLPCCPPALLACLP